jgi:hypothetical protein
VGAHTSTWKAHERRTARAIGGTRLGATGRENPDVSAGWLQAECKSRRLLPAWITTALGKVRQQAGPDGLGVVVLHEVGRRREGDVVCIAMKDWLDWYGELPIPAVIDDKEHRTDGQEAGGDQEAA